MDTTRLFNTVTNDVGVCRRAGAPTKCSLATSERPISTLGSDASARPPAATSHASSAPGSGLGPIAASYYLKNDLTIAETGATFAPPPDGSIAVSAQTAAAELGKRFGPLPSEAVPYLVVLTDSTYGEIQSDNSVRPYSTSLLVWAFISTDVPAATTGNYGAKMGSDGKPVPATLRPGSVCVAARVVNASTGKYLEGLSHCG